MKRVHSRVSDSAQQGSMELKRPMWVHFILKAKCFYVNLFKKHSQTLTHSMEEDIFLISCQEFLYLLQLPEFL